MNLRQNKGVQALLFFVVLFFIVTYLKNGTKRSAKRMHFNGVIQESRRDFQGYWHIKVKGKRYFLNNYWLFDDKLKVGNKIFKVKNEIDIRMIEKGKKDTIIFKGD
jgi:hypothetical protein